MADVQLTSVSKHYGDRDARLGHTAVCDVTLQINSGEFMVLVGPSGCGKSTTLRLIAGLEEPTAGVIKIAGRVVNDVAPKDRDVAMVFQNYALYPHMTVEENMGFALKLRKMPRQEVARRVQEVAEQLGLAQLLQRKPKELSGGQRQRVALGRAIVRKPKVFLFDEPLSNLDARMRVAMRAEICRLHARLKATMIYVTHDQVEAMTMGNRICVMDQGVVMQVDPPRRVYEHPANAFVAGFLGSPSMNLIKGGIESTGGAWRFVEDNSQKTPLMFPLSADRVAAGGFRSGDAVLLGIRPEDLREDPQGTAAADLEMVETTGPETYLHVSTGMHRLVLRAHSTFQRSIPAEIRLSADPSRIHLFRV